MKRLAVLILLCGLSIGSQASLMIWHVGDSGTTYQQWLFNSDVNPAAPEIAQNPYDDAVAAINNTLNPTAFSWSDGVWSGSKFSLTMDIPNNPAANPSKEVLVELVYQGQIVLSWAMDNDWNDFDNMVSQDTDLGNGWKKHTDLWRIEPNPSFERVCYGFNAETGGLAAVDSVAVSTICIPEPLTMVLLMLGTIALRKIKS
jgi:hypothetical protein